MASPIGGLAVAHVLVDSSMVTALAQAVVSLAQASCWANQREVCYLAAAASAPVAPWDPAAPVVCGCGAWVWPRGGVASAGTTAGSDGAAVPAPQGAASSSSAAGAFTAAAGVGGFSAAACAGPEGAQFAPPTPSGCGSMTSDVRCNGGVGAARVDVSPPPWRRAGARSRTSSGGGLQGSPWGGPRGGPPPALPLRNRFAVFADEAQRCSGGDVEDGTRMLRWALRARAGPGTAVRRRACPRTAKSARVS